MHTPNVFISYSHDSSDHKTWVRKLASDLRAAGVDASLDQWDLVPGQDIASFMHDGIAKADRVLLICSETYVQKSDGGHGGVGYERLIVTAEVIEAIDTKKFIPLVRANSLRTKTPKHLGPRLYIDFSTDIDYQSSLEDLCRELLGAPSSPKPQLGVNPFSGVIPVNNISVRSVSATGILDTGVPVLDSPWFETERAQALNGMGILKLNAGMELRFALHSFLSKSQIDLLTAVRASEIHTFGWPIGITLENRDEYRPRPFGDGIRAEVSIAKESLSGRESYDYWALSKNGDFYLLQNLFEDMRDEKKIYFNTRIVRVTEALMFAGGLYKNLGVPPEANLSIRVMHQGIAGRTLSSTGGSRGDWSNKCVETNCESEIVVTIGSIQESLVENVKHLTAPLFMLFEFKEFQDSIYEDIVHKFEAGKST